MAWSFRKSAWIKDSWVSSLVVLLDAVYHTSNKLSSKVHKVRSQSATHDAHCMTRRDPSQRRRGEAKIAEQELQLDHESTIKIRVKWRRFLRGANEPTQPDGNKWDFLWNNLSNLFTLCSLWYVASSAPPSVHPGNHLCKFETEFNFPIWGPFLAFARARRNPSPGSLEDCNRKFRFDSQKIWI